MGYRCDPSTVIRLHDEHSAGQTSPPVSPFDLLATELIQRIMLFAVHLTDHLTRPPFIEPHGEPYFPYKAAYVSKTWRSIAASDHNIWRTLYLHADCEVMRMSDKINKHLALVNDLSLDLVVHLASRLKPETMALIRQYGHRCRNLRWIYYPMPRPPWYPMTVSDTLAPTPGSPQIWEALEELILEGDSFFNLTSDNWFQVVDGIPNLKRFSVKAFKWDTENGEIRKLSSFSKLQEMTIHMKNLNHAAWLLRNAEYPALEGLVVVCETHLDLHQMQYWKREGRMRPLPSVRRAALYGTGEHASVILLGCLPNLEKLAVSCDPKGRIPACLKDPLRWLDLTALIIRNTYPIRLDRVVENIGPRIRSLKALVLNEDFAASRKSRKFRAWSEEFTKVEVWAESEFHMDTVLYRMSF